MTDKILLVDDEPNILNAFQRQLRGICAAQIDVTTQPERVMELFAKNGPYAVICSDMRMPNKNGLQLLSEVKGAAPQTVRIMLTGEIDVQVAINAINEGSIFRFLNKPCSTENLAKAINDGIQQYHLIISEKDILNRTMVGIIRMLTEILSIIDPGSFGEATKFRASLAQVAKALNLTSAWELELAWMLSTIGHIAVPSTILKKVYSGVAVSTEEGKILVKVPETGHRLLAHIPRLEGIAKAILYQNKNFDGSGFPEDKVLGDQIPFASRMIRIMREFSRLQSQGKLPHQAIEAMTAVRGIYDPQLLLLISPLFVPPDITPEVKPVGVKITAKELRQGQTVLTDIETIDGVLIIKKGTLITEIILTKLNNYASLIGLTENIYVDKKDPTNEVAT